MQANKDSAHTRELPDLAKLVVGKTGLCEEVAGLCSCDESIDGAEGAKLRIVLCAGSGRDGPTGSATTWCSRGREPIA